MTYEFVSMEDAGTGTGDFIVKLRRKPSQFRRRFGAQEETVAYYGQNAKWHAMDGLPASSSVRAVLEKFWHEKCVAKVVKTFGCTSNSPKLLASFATGKPESNSELAVRTTPQSEPTCDVVEVASEDSFPANDPPAWTLGR